MNRSTRFLIALTLCVTVLTGTVPFASADTATDLQNQLKSVLNQINSLKAQLGTTDVGSGSVSGCPKITRMLRRGSKGSDVLALQSYLDANIYPEGTASGFFGFATERAVQRFQERHGIAVAGTADTTGYGLVGTRTRLVLASACSGDTGTSTVGTGTGTGTSAAQVVNFAFDQSVGTAPYDARIKLSTLDTACVSYEVDWGDKTDPTVFEAPQSTVCGSGISERTLQHTYTSAGTYIATLKAGKGPRSGLPKLLTRSIQIAKGEPYLRMDSPSAGNSVRLGDLTKIKWTTGNYPTDSAIAFYVVGPTQTYSFAKRSMRTSEFDWIVGDGVCDGNTCSVQMPTGSYKIRAAMYTPADGCIDFCGADDKRASVVLVTESGNFAVTQLGTSGGTPITVSNTRGIAPLAVNIHTEIAPTSTASNFEVDFGDNSQKYTIHIPIGETRSTVRDIPHTYTKTGNYTVELRPSGAVQNVGSAQITVDTPKFAVIPRDGAYAPATAKATFDVDTSCSLGNANSRRYTVDWGDASETSVYEFTPTRCVNDIPLGQTITQQVLTHVYTDSGSRTVKYRASNGTYSYDATSGVNLGAPTLTVSPTFGFKPMTATASFKADQSCSASAAATATYTIDWGDSTAPTTHSVTLPACGTTHTSSLVEKSFSHSYTTVGNFTLKLTSGRSDIAQTLSTTKNIVVDEDTSAYLWHRVVGLLSGTESIMQQTASAAHGFYRVINGK